MTDQGAANGVRSGIVAALTLGAVLAMVAACSPSGTSVVGPTSAASPQPILAEAERDGIRVTLALDGPPRGGELSWANARVENTRREVVSFVGGGCNDSVSISIEAQTGFEPGRQWPGRLGEFKTLAIGGGPLGKTASLGYEEESRIPKPGDHVLIACPADWHVNELAPGEVRTIRAAWDGTIGGVAPAPSGPATVVGLFPFLAVGRIQPQGIIDPIPIEARIATTVVGEAAATALSPSLAIDAALADPEFAAWVQEADSATWINPHVVFADETWAIGLFRDRDAGRSTVFSEVFVGPDGTVVGRRSEG